VAVKFHHREPNHDGLKSCLNRVFQRKNTRLKS